MRHTPARRAQCARDLRCLSRPSDGVRSRYRRLPSERGYIGGVLPNTRENLVKWLLDPQGASPQSLMPNMELTEAHANDIARYLFEES